jgi:4-amino-4-deoxy-L-arabinose transferase-like glycosyltransferase
MFADESSSRLPGHGRGLPAGWVVLLVAVLAPLFINLDSPPLWDGSEPFYAETAREMVEGGDWWTLHYNYRPRFEKPPLPVWVLAASYKLFGVGEWAARLPLALAAALILVWVGRLGAELARPADGGAGARTGLLAALVTGTTFKFFGFARQYAGDVFLALGFVAALDLFLRWERSGGARRWCLRGAWAVLGLSVLVKGPVGLLPAIIGLAYLAVRRRLALALHWRPVLEGAGIVALMAAPWYAYQVARFGWDYVRVFLIEQNLARVVSEQLGAQPVWFYFPVILGGALPWSVVLAGAVVEWLAPPSAGLARGRKQSWRESPYLLPAVWFAVVFLFFSLARGKRDVYLLPLYPALGLLVGIYLERALAEGRRRVLALTAGWLVLYALGFAGLGALLWRWLGTAWGLALVAVAVAAAVALTILAWQRRWQAGGAVAFGFLAAVLMIAALALTPLGHYRPVPEVAALIRAQAAPQEPVATYFADLPSLMFYARRPLAACWTREEFAAVLAKSPRVWAVMIEPVYEGAAADFRDYRWERVATRPYLLLTRAHLERLRAGQVGMPLVLARIERNDP